MDFNKLIEAAKKIDASDIHLMENSPPCFRVDGVMRKSQAADVTRATLERLLAEIMPERLSARLAERRAADFCYEHKGHARTRVVAYYERECLRIVARLIPLQIPSIDELGLSPALKKFKEYRFGLTLVTGPTGSGKTSTLAAIMMDINAAERHCIITIEDPVEFFYPNEKCIISQREVGADVPAFSDGVIQAMRQDPDVILIGEMRDRETIRAAIKASETGHLVFSTLHTNSAVQSIERIIGNFGQEEHQLLREQLASNLRGNVTQRLIKRASGSGRVAVQEILICADMVSKLIFENRLSDINEVMKSGEEGMQTFDLALANLVRAKTVALEEALRQCRDEFAFRRFVKGVASANDRGGIIAGFG